MGYGGRSPQSVGVLHILTFSIAAAVTLGVLSTACGGKKLQKTYVKDCVLPDDQSGTLTGHWKSSPVPIALQSGAWADSEAADIIAGASTWNAFSDVSIGGDLLANQGSSGTTLPSRVCSQGILLGTGYTGPVVIYKRADAWPHPAGAIAVTSVCPVKSTSGLSTFYMAITEVNYVNFFVQGKPLPDLQSIVAHEFGHLLGLGHSCEVGSTTSGVPDCNASGISADYTSALMFPVFGFDGSGLGEVRHDVNNNDQGRMNCLYQTDSSS